MKNSLPSPISRPLPPSVLRPSVLLVAAVCLFAAFPAPGRAGHILDDLSAAQKKRVLAGEQVFLLEDVKGQPWPRISVYQLVHARPEQVAAVFFDFAAACDYVPNVTKSEIATVVAPNIQEVDYSIDVPILPDEHYTVRNRLTDLGDDSYRVDWKLLRAIQTKDSVGEFLVQPCEGKTIVRYRNLTTPASSMAGLLRGKAIEQIRATVEAICTEVTRLKKSDEPALNHKVEKLKAAAGG